MSNSVVLGCPSLICWGGELKIHTKRLMHIASAILDNLVEAMSVRFLPLFLGTLCPKPSFLWGSRPQAIHQVDP